MGQLTSQPRRLQIGPEGGATPSSVAESADQCLAGEVRGGPRKQCLGVFEKNENDKCWLVIWNMFYFSIYWE